MAKKAARNRSPRSERITEQLLEQVARNDESAYSIIELIGSRAIRPLLKALQGPPPAGVHGRDAQENLTDALALAAREDAGPLIREIRAGKLNPDPYLVHAYSALGGSRDECATVVLIEGLSHSNQYVRETALRHLCDRNTPDVVEFILPRICDRSSFLCVTAISALEQHATYRDERAIPWLERLLKRKHVQTREFGLKRRVMALLEKIKAEQSAACDGERIESLDWPRKQFDLQELREIIAGHPLRSLNLKQASGVDNRVVRAISEASRLEELTFHNDGRRQLDLRPLSKLKNLKALRLGCVNVAGALAQLLDGFPRLEHLDLKGSGIGDDDLKCLGNLGHLKHLELDWRTTDAGFEHIRDLTGLEALYYHGSGHFFHEGPDEVAKVSSTALQSLRRMKRLRRLGFDSSLIGEGDPEALLALPRLEFLSLTGGECSGSPLANDCLRVIGKLKRLRFLDIAGNPGITERGVRHLRSLKRLEGISVGYTPVPAEYVDVLIKLPNLRIVSHPRITRTARQQLRAAKPDCLINEFHCLRTYMNLVEA